MTPAEGLLVFLHDPIVWLLLLVLALLAYHFSGGRRRRLNRRRVALRAQVRHAATPRQRREALQQWRELGGVRERRRGQAQRDARAQGQQARAAGRTRWANPYRQSWWGSGRLWRSGWEAVDRNIRWIEKRRDQA